MNRNFEQRSDWGLTGHQIADLDAKSIRHQQQQPQRRIDFASISLELAKTSGIIIED